ncbi:MAG: lysylphosphatidylglycerol synthase transmembrane domain-containing protein [Vicinamibacterales bacterium]
MSLAIAAIVAAVLLYYSLRGIEWREVGRIVSGADAGLLALTGAIATATLFLRAWRWRILLNAEGSVGVATTFWATAAGLFGNNFLPARAGELIRTYMISSQCGLAKSYVLATALSERIADAIVLAVMSAVVLLTFPPPPGWLAGAALPVSLLALAGAAAIAVLPTLGPAGLAIIARAPVPASFKPRLATAMEHGLRGLRGFHDVRRLSGFGALAVVIWFADAAGTVLGGAALGLRIPVPAAFLLIAGLSLGSALPSTPGYIGIYQFVAVSVLTPFALSRADAIAFILVSQAVGYVVIGLWGAIGLVRYRRGPRKDGYPGC